MHLILELLLIEDYELHICEIDAIIILIKHKKQPKK